MLELANKSRFLLGIEHILVFFYKYILVIVIRIDFSLICFYIFLVIMF